MFIAQLLFNVLIEDKPEGFNDVQLAKICNNCFSPLTNVNHNSSAISHWEIMTLNLCYALQKLFICDLHFFPPAL